MKKIIDIKLFGSMKAIALLFTIHYSLFISPVRAQIGQPYIHDPSTIAECDGKY